MAENIFSVDKCESDLSPKINEKHSTEVEDNVDKCVMKNIRPLLIVLPVIGISIKEVRNIRCEIYRMFYLFLLLLIVLWLIVWQSNQMLIYKFADGGSWFVSFTFPYAVVVVVFVAAFKNRKIGHLLKDTLISYTETADVCGANRRLKRWMWPLWLVITVAFFAIESMIIAQDFEADYVLMREFLQRQFFGIKSDNVIVLRTVHLGTYIALYFNLYLFNLFGCFAILQCFLIRECFSGLNIELKANGDEYLKDYITGHRKISKIVDQFNKTLHPAILIFVCILMINLVSLTVDTAKDVQMGFDVPLDLTHLAQAVTIFIVFVFFGSEIQCEARNGIEILLDSSITSCTNEEMRNKNGQIVNLFIAKLNTSPVAISASGLFDINVKLITIVISIAITYFALVFKTPDTMEEVKNALRTLSSLSNNLTLLSSNLTLLSSNLTLLSNNLSAVLN